MVEVGGPAPGPERAGSGRLPRGYARGEGRDTPGRAVWVDLEALFPPAPAADRTSAASAGPAPRPVVPDGLDLRGEVHGLLHYWARGSDGRWVAVVSFRVPYRAENRHSPGLEVSWTPVPASVVRPGRRPTGSDVVG